MTVFKKHPSFPSNKELCRDHPDPKIRQLAYRPSWVDRGVIRPPKTTPATRNLQETTDRKPLQSHSSELSQFSLLPVEVFHEIFNYVGIQDLVSLRQTRRTTNAHVLAYPPWRSLQSQAPILLQALLTTKLGYHHTAAAVLDAARADRCCGCDHCGPFVFLPTLERCCHRCRETQERFRVIAPAAAHAVFSLPSQVADSLAKMLTCPGMYGFGSPRPIRRRRWLVSVKHMIEAVAVHEGVPVQTVLERGRQRFLEDGPEMREAGSRSRHEWGRVLKFEDDEDPFAGMAILTVAFVRPNGTLEHPLWCIGCDGRFIPRHMVTEDDGGDFMLGIYRAKRAYTEAELLSHVDECPGARYLWNKLKAGRHSG